MNKAYITLYILYPYIKLLNFDVNMKCEHLYTFPLYWILKVL